jgi:hypothetical protein
MTDPVADETLDPADWEAMRRLAHQAVDDGFAFLQQVRDRPVWQPIPPEVLAQLRGAAPRLPQGADAAYRDFRELVMPYSMGNTHPRFWSWFMGNGTAFAAVGDFLAAVINPNMGGGNHMPNQVEGQVVDWCREIAGRHRRARTRRGRDRAAAGDVRLGRSAQLRAEGDRVPRAGGAFAAPGAGQHGL